MQSLWSPHWHAVRTMRPRLRNGVEALHRRLRGRPWVLLHDPVTHRFHRLSPAVWEIVSELDGRRTLEQVWRGHCERAANRAAAGSVVSQSEIVQLMSQLYANDLLQTQNAPDAAETLERHDRQQRQRLRQSTLNPLSIRVPLLRPEAWFQRHRHLCQLVWSRPTLLAWLVLVLPAALAGWQHWQALTENLSDRVLSANNLLLLWLVYPCVKAVHEFAHGIAVKAYGGTVREIGVMFVALLPVPYVDATSSYRFASKWQRAAVASAGIAAELLLGAAALWVWLAAEPGWVSATAYNVVLIAGVSTLLVNGNPLMRYDGYFVASDLLEVPNLAQRAQQYWTYLFDRWFVGSREAQPPQAVGGERLLLGVYGALSPVYRLLITIGLIWFVASEYLLVGAIMALMAAWGVVIMPIWKALKHLNEAATLARHRERAWRRSVAALAGVLVFLLAVPLPFNAMQQGVTWVADEAIVRAEAPGHVVQALQRGASVTAGAVLVRIDDPIQDAELGVAAAALKEAEAQLRHARTRSPAEATPWDAEVQARGERLDEARRRVALRSVSAVYAGRWVAAAATSLEGRYVRRGEVLGYVISGPTRIVRVAVPQEDMQLIDSRMQLAEVRLGRSPVTLVRARAVNKVPGGTETLVSPALGTAGGGAIPVDPSQGEGRQALRRVFDLELELEQAVPSATFGERVDVRFDLGESPLAFQWALRVRQLFLARLGV